MILQRYPFFYLDAQGGRGFEPKVKVQAQAIPRLERFSKRPLLVGSPQIIVQ
jgi:hypothetical protein